MSEAEKKYHRNRRMFFLIDDTLIVPPPYSERSHKEWLIENGWTKDEAQKIIDNELRGALNPDGNIRFYFGENWEVNEKIEKLFFKILPDLVDKLSINFEAEIGGGAIQQEEGTFWPARKYYGKVKDFIKTDQVILVDENDNEIGTEEKIAAHENGGKKHRAFSILIFNDKNEVMLQQRAFNKYHAGGLWTNTCCSHPRPNEETKAAAHRRLKEEMGFDCELEEKFCFNYTAKLDKNLTENEYDHVFVGFYNNDPVINKEEAESWKWISISDLDLDIKNNPENYTPWFKIIWNQVKDHPIQLG